MIARKGVVKLRMALIYQFLALDEMENGRAGFESFLPTCRLLQASPQKATSRRRARRFPAQSLFFPVYNIRLVSRFRSPRVRPINEKSICLRFGGHAVIILSALSRRSLFEAKDESRKQSAESEKAKEAAVEEAVTRVKRQVEESMSETYR